MSRKPKLLMVPFIKLLCTGVSRQRGKVSLAPVEEERMRRDGSMQPQNRSTLINFFSRVVQEFADEFVARPAVTLATLVRTHNCSRASRIELRRSSAEFGVEGRSD